MNKQIELKLWKFLNLNWLRPENGLLCAFMSSAFDDVIFESPSLDLSCADGLFTFIHLGGEIDENFDYYKKTKAKNFKHSSFVDIYDIFEEDYTVDILKKPSFTIDVGTDWKQNLLNKASKLDLYKKLIQHDNNHIPLPFNDDYFKTIYSNSIYWVSDVNKLLSDIHRILHPRGTAILQVMTPYHLETLNELSTILSPQAIEILDRKRRETMPSLLNYEEWKELILQNGFIIKEIRNTYPHKMILDIWNIGLRPIAHLLIQMTDELTKEQRAEVKKEWVTIFFELFKPLLQINQNVSLEKSAYPCFILNK